MTSRSQVDFYQRRSEPNVLHRHGAFKNEISFVIILNKNNVCSCGVINTYDYFRQHIIIFL